MRIQNPVTGEEKDISLDEAPKYGITVDDELRKKLVKQYNKGWIDLPPEVGSWKEYGQKLPGQLGTELKGWGEGAVAAVPLALKTTPPAMLLESAKDIQEMSKGGKPWERHQQELKQMGSLGFEAGKGVVEDLWHLLRYPTQQFYKKPAGTALDAAMLAGAAIKGGKAITSAVKGAQAEKQLSTQLMAYAARDPEGFAKAVNQMAATQVVTPEAAAISSKAAGKVAQETGEQLTEEGLKRVKSVSPAVMEDLNRAEQTYASLFVIPQKRAKDLKPLQTARDMVRYNVTGNFDDMKRAAATVTGSDGALSTIARDITSVVPEIDTSKVLNAVEEVGGKMTEVSADDIDKVTRLVASKLPVTQGVTTAVDVAGMSPDDIARLQAKHIEKMKYLDDVAAATGKAVEPTPAIISRTQFIDDATKQSFALRDQLETVQKALSKAPDSEDLQNAVQRITSKLEDLDTKRLEAVILNTKEKEKLIQNVAKVKLPPAPTEEYITTGPISDISTMHPAENSYDLMKQLERIAADYRRKSTYLTPNLRMEQLSDLYSTAAREIENAIEKRLKNANILEAYKTDPEYLSKLARVSPTLVEDFKKARTFRDLRRLQAPFVRLSQMIDMTRDASLSTANKLAAQMGSAIAGGAATEIGLGPLSLGGRYSPVGMIGKAVAAPILGPILQTQMQGAIPKTLSKAATTIPAKSAALRATLKAGKVITGAPGKAIKEYLRNAFLRRLITNPKNSEKNVQTPNLATEE